MPKETGYEEAIRRAVEKLRGVDLSARCANLGLPQPGKDTLRFRAFGTEVELRLPGFQLFFAGSEEPVKTTERVAPATHDVTKRYSSKRKSSHGNKISSHSSMDRVLLLHYLLCDLPLENTGELISFRELPGGQFFWEPFLARSVRPLIKRTGNDLESLKRKLKRFDWEPLSIGDFSARIHTVGKIYLTLVYRLGDDEFPPTADLLFDSFIKRVYNAEDAAVLAGRMCLSLI